MDGIVTNLLQAWLGAIQDKFNIKIDISDVTNWDVAKAAPLKGIKESKIYGIIQKPMFFWDLKVLPGAFDTIQELHKDGHNIKFLTTPASAQSAYEKMLWVDKHFPFVGQKNVILTKDKHLVKGDVFLDDKGSAVEEYAKAWPDALVMTFGYPYNSYLINHPAILTAGEWFSTTKAWDVAKNLIIKKAENET